MAQVYRRVRLLVSPTIVGVQLTDQQRTAQAPRAAREGHARSQADVTTRRQRKVAAGGGATATTVVELETQSAAGNPTYLAVEQRCDEFAAHLVGLYDSPALPVGAGRPTLDHPAAASVRLIGRLSSDTVERAHAELTRPPEKRPTKSDPT